MSTTPSQFPPPPPLPRQYTTTTPDNREDDPEAWKQSALCAQIGGDGWFPEKGGQSSDAKRVCDVCPVAAECLQYALANGEQFGLWGGLTTRQRRNLLKKRDAA